MSDLDDRLRASLRAIDIDGPPLGIAHQRVLRRATERRTARRFRWIGGALALLALPGSAATVAFAGREEGRTRVEVVQPDTDTGADTDAPAPVPDVDASGPDASGRDDAGAGADAVVAPTPSAGAATAAPRPFAAGTTDPPPAEGGGGATASPPAPVAPSASTTTAPAPAGSPPADEGCEVEGYDDRSVYVPDGGAGAGAPPSCTYEATQPGGYVAAGDSWTIEIQRNGFARTLSGRNGDPACGPLGTIQPGDRVTVTVRDGLERAATPRHVRAGPRWHC